MDIGFIEPIGIEGLTAAFVELPESNLSQSGDLNNSLRYLLVVGIVYSRVSQAEQPLLIRERVDLCMHVLG